MSESSGEKKRSALRVMKGVEGGHQGLPGAERTQSSQPPASRRAMSTEQYAEGVLAGDRGVLARAITLVESNAPAHFAQAQELLQRLLPHAGQSVRIGITGVPGAGKSTLIEALGLLLIERGHRIGVTAVDPTSSVRGGSILGDKTRMETLASSEAAFIRPSPSGGQLGGVTRKTRETIVLLEAAGFDVILVETVGVGQSEVTVRSMVDFFLLLLVAGAGDELQGIKRGVVEIADAIVINKAEGPGRQAALSARGEYQRALHYLTGATEGWDTRAHICSASSGEGIAELWTVIQRFVELTRAAGSFDSRRREQRRAWIHALVRQRLEESFAAHPDVAASLPELEREVMEGRLPATSAATRLLELYRDGGKDTGEGVQASPGSQAGN